MFLHTPGFTKPHTPSVNSVALDGPSEFKLINYFKLK